MKKKGYCFLGKRCFDIIFSTVGLIILSPLFLFISFAIKFDSPGKVVFRQERVGKDGKIFWIYKFRTMCVDAEEKLAQLKEKNEMQGNQFKIKNDPRITRVGKFLRKSSMDEFPQLWNVLKGDMSLIGPRPALPEEVAQYTSFEKERLKIKPGCSGMWQVSGRNNLTFDQMIELDLMYIKDVSFITDMFILLKTVKVIITQEGAY
ncbi:sugar transferase [Enterococcus lactis]|uniref:sugar transferase n=1 Tax=Enterococcus lactis TaxID=357441 RepID=UPI004041F82E